MRRSIRPSTILDPSVVAAIGEPDLEPLKGFAFKRASNLAQHIDHARRLAGLEPAVEGELEEAGHFLADTAQAANAHPRPGMASLVSRYNSMVWSVLEYRKGRSVGRPLAVLSLLLQPRPRSRRARRLTCRN
jgi:hypothetical protein